MSLERLSVRLFLAIGVAGSAIALLCGTPAKGEEVGDIREANKNLPQLSEIERPATSAQTLVQTPSDPFSVAPYQGNSSSVPPYQGGKQGGVVSITGVVANPTDKGVEIILQTTQGKILQPVTLALGRTYIANIPNAVLALPQGGEFRQDNPASGITLVRVTQATTNSIRVAVTGEAALPQVQLYDAPNEGLVFSFTPGTSAAQTPPAPEGETQPEKPLADEQEIVVTDEQDGYNVPNASTATRTDTPLRDIPQSIQVVPQEVLRDQNITTYNEALRNVPGVAPFNSSTTQINNFIIRGFLSFDFASNLILRNGLREAGGLNAETTPDIERIEVLLGPASVLYGAVNPGGTINLVTKQPLRDPFYAVDATIGSYDFYRGAIDLSGPLNDSRTVLYRLNASYLDRGSFIDFVERDQFTIAPVVSMAIGERTRFTLEGEYTETNEANFTGLPAVGTVLPNPNGDIPRNRFVGNPDFVLTSQRSRVGYRLEHEFSNNWSLQNVFQVRFFDRIWKNGWRISTSLDPDNRILNGEVSDEEDNINIYDLNANLTGRFSTGSIEHQLVFGVDLGRYERNLNLFTAPAVPLDVFNPVYEQIFAGPYINDGKISSVTDTLGIYIQDQVTLAPNLKLLLGGRFDLFEQITQDLLTDTRTSQSGNAFSPRVGIVYQPIEPISLYASYSRSFNPVTGTAFDDSPFQPQRGTQYEVGVKADLNDRLSTTLAFYDLTRTNVLTTDPDNPNFSIQTGEQRSQGIELRVQGEILPGWNIFAGYAYTDARITQDNAFPVGNRLNGVPENALNLWTSYEIQQGTLQGLGVGLGLFYVGGRQVDLDNSVELPSYLRTDAAIFYRREQFRAALNFRNLFNVDYFESAFSPLTISYGELFTVQGTISWQF